jgi:hypothetical protein
MREIYVITLIDIMNNQCNYYNKIHLSYKEFERSYLSKTIKANNNRNPEFYSLSHKGDFITHVSLIF